MDTYSEAHLFVAAVRILTYKEAGPPSLEAVCQLLGFSTESGHAICRNLHKLDIIDTIEDPFSIRVSLVDHLAIEKIPQLEEKKPSIEDELARFQAKKQDLDAKAAKLQNEMEQKKKKMFAELEARIKKEME